jgi:phage FluMu protein Com
VPRAIVDRLSQPRPSTGWSWLRCAQCGHKVCLAAPGLVASVVRRAGDGIEIKCRACKTLNYLGAPAPG